MKSQSFIIGEKFEKSIAGINPVARRDMESFVVNSIKVKIIKSLDEKLETEGRKNLRHLFLSPVFTVKELTSRVIELAPEMKTFYFKQLISTFDEAEEKFF